MESAFFPGHDVKLPPAGPSWPGRSPGWPPPREACRACNQLLLSWLSLLLPVPLRPWRLRAGLVAHTLPPRWCHDAGCHSVAPYQRSRQALVCINILSQTLFRCNVNEVELVQPGCRQASCLQRRRHPQCSLGTHGREASAVSLWGCQAVLENALGHDQNLPGGRC